MAKAEPLEHGYLGYSSLVLPSAAEGHCAQVIALDSEERDLAYTCFIHSLTHPFIHCCIYLFNKYYGVATMFLACSECWVFKREYKD